MGSGIEGGGSVIVGGGVVGESGEEQGGNGRLAPSGGILISAMFDFYSQ